MALVHILTPEFSWFLIRFDFEDIPEEVVARASAEDLHQNLVWNYVPVSLRDRPELSAFSFQVGG